MEISEKPCECRFTINRGFKVAISSCDSNVKEGELTIGFNFTSKVNVIGCWRLRYARKRGIWSLERNRRKVSSTYR